MGVTVFLGRVDALAEEEEVEDGRVDGLEELGDVGLLLVVVLADAVRHVVDHEEEEVVGEVAFLELDLLDHRLAGAGQLGLRDLVVALHELEELREAAAEGIRVLVQLDQLDEAEHVGEQLHISSAPLTFMTHDT